SRSLSRFQQTATAAQLDKTRSSLARSCAACKKAFLSEKEAAMSAPYFTFFPGGKTSNELVRPRQQQLPDSIEPGHRTRRSRRIRWRRRNRTDKQQQPEQARPRSPSRRRRPREGNSTATCVRWASPLTGPETQTL